MEETHGRNGGAEMSNAWELHNYVATDAPPERRFATAMYRVSREKIGPDKYAKTAYSMWFIGPSSEDVKRQIDQFWEEQAGKAENRKAGQEKAAKSRATKAAK